MAVDHTTLHEYPTKAHSTNGCGCGCGCGCSPCKETCCSLDCLVRPRFFCGQLLTDGELTAMQSWTQNKFRLHRHDRGWGVVCGLAVRCEPLAHGTIVVGAGYAVDPCGEDIILCEEATLDLSGACGPEIDPCADLPIARAARSDLESRYRESYDPPAEDGDDETEQEDVVADVYVRYREEEAEPLTAFGRGVCGEVAVCEPSRTREVFELHFARGSVAADPVAIEAARWEEGYARCSEVVERFRDAFASLSGADPDEIRRWLVRWIDAHPLQQFCWLRGQVCALGDEEVQSEETIASILFTIVQDCRNAYLVCACACGVDSPGVPLARVWLRANGSGACHVRHVDPYPPYRRPLSETCWPARHGEVNVGRVIWHRAEEACTILDDLGVSVTGEVDFEIPPTLAELEQELACRPFVACDQAVVAQVLDAEELGRRVVGFCGTRRGTIGLRIDKGSTATEASRGDDVTYTVDVWNTGSVDLDLEIDDVPVGHVASERLAAGTSKRWEYTYTVPSDAAGELRNTVTVVGTADDGRTITQTDTHTIKVPEPTPPLTIRVEKTANTEEATPGEQVSYTFTVHNTNDVPVTIRGEDDLYAEIVGGERVEAQGTWSTTLDRDVIGEFGDTVTNTFKAVAAAADGRTAEAAAQHSIRVVRRPDDGLGLEVTKEVLRGTPTPGSTIYYSVRVQNTGTQALTLAFEDALVDGLPEGLEVEPGGEEFIRYRGEIPESYNRPEWVNTIKVTGTAESGATTEASDTLRLELRLPEAPPTPLEEQPGEDLQVIHNIGRARAERLREAGIRSRSDLAELTPSRLAGIIEVGREAAEAILRAAREGNDR